MEYNVKKYFNFNFNPWDVCFRYRYLNAEKHCLANNYLLKLNNRNTRKKCEICSKLTIKTPERRHGVFIVTFEDISPHFQCFYCSL